MIPIDIDGMALHCLPLLAAPQVRGMCNKRDPRHPSGEPEFSSGWSVGSGYGSLRHVSSVDWFLAWADPRP
jgi:hypothetical protein